VGVGKGGVSGAQMQSHKNSWLNHSGFFPEAPLGSSWRSADWYWRRDAPLSSQNIRELSFKYA
jgi:hypothetical protein